MGRAGKSGNVVAWDIKTGERILEVGKEYDCVLGADVSPDLKRAVMGGPGRNIKIWDTVAGEQVAAEFIQHDAKPEQIAAEINRLIEDRGYYEERKEKLKQVKAKLGDVDGIDGISNLALEMLEEN